MADHKHYDAESTGSIVPRLHPLGKAEQSKLLGENTFAFSKIGSTTSVQTSMQLAEVEARLREGLRVVEMGTIRPDVFEAIPREHFKEMHQLAKLAGAEVTVHSPVQIDPAGMSQRGWMGEQARQQSERQLKDVITRSMDINPDGNVPVVIHAAGADVPAREWVKDEKGKIVTSMLYAVNQDTGEMVPLKREKVIRPGEGEVIKSPEERLKNINETQWENKQFEVVNILKESDKIIGEVEGTGGAEVVEALRRGQITENELRANPTLREAASNYERRVTQAKFYIEESQRRVADLYEKAHQTLEKEKDNKRKSAIKKVLEKIDEEWNSLPDNLEMIAEQKKKRGEGDLTRIEVLRAEEDLINSTIRSLGELRKENPPQLFKPVEDFARDHAAKTLSNVALHAKEEADKSGRKAPTLVIENVWPNIAFSTADELRGLIEESRAKVATELVTKKGYEKERAEREAEKLIGATWDIGHINNLRKYGYEEKEIVEQTKKMGKMIKHFHLHDNFGYEDSHLPPGMGNVPLKKIFGLLKEQGYEGKAIIEAGAFAAAFKASPQLYSMQALDSPIYGTGTGWGSLPRYSSYFSSYGTFLPQQHFSMYGGGFSQLPTELGGRVGGPKGAGFSGSPME